MSLLFKNRPPKNQQSSVTNGGDPLPSFFKNEPTLDASRYSQEEVQEK
jgi:hypothetical protein